MICDVCGYEFEEGERYYLSEELEYTCCDCLKEYLAACIERGFDVESYEAKLAPAPIDYDFAAEAAKEERLFEERE